jgi:hypothetical protein
MKKLHLLVLAGVALVAVSVYAIEQVRRDAAGLHIGSASTDRIGFYGATPIAQKGIGITLTNGAALAECVTKLQSIHNALILSGLCKTNAP